LNDAAIKTAEIEIKRETYLPVAIRGSVLYFCIIEIATVNWMYNSSLDQFLVRYENSIVNSEKDPHDAI
jgi:dynein heavy chain, axonemal